MGAMAVFVAAVIFEIAGCFAFWAWWRLGQTPLWLLPGTAALIGFAWLLSLSPAAQAGRSFATYGGIYIACSLVWLWLIEGQRPDRWDVLGGAVCMIGATIILLGPRTA